MMVKQVAKAIWQRLHQIHEAWDPGLMFLGSPRVYFQGPQSLQPFLHSGDAESQPHDRQTDNHAMGTLIALVHIPRIWHSQKISSAMVINYSWLTSSASFNREMSEWRKHTSSCKSLTDSESESPIFYPQLVVTQALPCIRNDNLS